MKQTNQQSESSKPRLAVFKFASCDGCQLSLLSLEDDLLALADKIEIALFLEASSHIEPGPYDVALVEGSITTAHDRERIQQVRRQSDYVVTIGACATSGGIQALKNWKDHEEFISAVYAHPEFIETLSTSTGIAEHIDVDFELRGCPINRHQLLDVLTSLLNGITPRTPKHAVCMECKRRGIVCIEVAQGVPCLGPVTQAGCGALCTAYDRGCFGCFGPATQVNCNALVETFQHHGIGDEELVPLFRNYNAAAPEFVKQSDQLLNTERKQ